MVSYLSDEWVHAVHTTASTSPAIRKAATGITIGVTQDITVDGRSDFVYHLVSSDGAVEFGIGPAPAEDIRFTQSRQTAVKVATGKLAAQEAFVTGKIRMTGNHQKLVDAQPLFAALEAVFDRVRQNTEYP